MYLGLWRENTQQEREKKEGKKKRDTKING